MPRHVTTPPPPYEPNPLSMSTENTGFVTDPVVTAVSIPALRSPTASETEIETFSKYHHIHYND